MDLGLRGKVALVAAASQGMGQAAAMALAREGCRIAICARTRGPLNETAEAIRKATSAEVVSVAVDLARPEGPSAFVERALEAYGGLDVLVGNAGGPPTGTFDSVPEAEWDRIYGLTFQSTARLVRAALPALRHRGGGSIVLLQSISVKQPLDNLILSNAMRGAVLGLAKSLARELAKDSIRVNVVAPGYVGPDRLLEVVQARAEKEGVGVEATTASMAREIPLGRFGTPEEIGDLVAFLASPRAAYITGDVVQIDGGLYRGIP